MKKIGLIVIVVGLAMAVFTGFDFFTREKIVNVGSVEIVGSKKHSLDWSPALGLVAAAVGAGIFFVGSRRSSK
jgi:hypothetical protein